MLEDPEHLDGAQRGPAWLREGERYHMRQYHLDLSAHGRKIGVERHLNAEGALAGLLPVAVWPQRDEQLERRAVHAAPAAVAFDLRDRVRPEGKQIGLGQRRPSSGRLWVQIVAHHVSPWCVPTVRSPRSVRE